MLWLCLDLPFLPLELRTRANPGSAPAVIGEGTGSASYVLLANEAAMQCGIRPGLSLSAAYALASSLKVFPPDPVAERSALERVAAWAGKFTSTVSVVEDSARNGRAAFTLLLEIGGSLGLFGGLERLRHAVRTDITELGYHAVLSVAPTPLAAMWFARGGDEKPVLDLPTLAGRLFPLSIDCLDLAPDQHALLREIGLVNVGDCLRLPRAGLAQRLGTEFVRAIDRAFGRIPDPRKAYVAPACFNASFTLPSSVEHTEGVLFPLNRLLLELAGFLTARVAGVQRLHLHLRHPRQPATSIELGLVRASRDARHLADLFRERLGRLELPEPVEEITLSAPALLPLPAADVDCFKTRHASHGTMSELVERLSARLGREVVRGLTLVADHRPERAWRYTEPDPGQTQPPLPSVLFSVPERPLWLLPAPIALSIRDGQPWLDGTLTLAPDRERIESGWWEGTDVRRDYRIAHDREGARFWIYRELGKNKNENWWLQGVFS